MLKRNIKLAFRKLSRRKEFTLINSFGLLIGFTTSMFILLWVNDELSFDRFHNDQDQLYAVWNHSHYDNGQKGTANYLTAAMKESLDADYPEIEMVTRVGNGPEHQWSVGEKVFKSSGYRVDEEFLQMFNFPVIHGQLEENSLATDKDLIITESLAMKLFGRTDVAGETVRMDNKRDVVVKAVLADPPANSRFQFEYLTSVDHWSKRMEWTRRWGNGSVENFVKLKEGLDLEQFNAKVANIINENVEDDISEVFLKPVSELYLYSEYEQAELVGGRIEYVQLFSIVAIVIMLIACINFVNLSFAEAFKRAKEVGVRKVIGAGKRHLMMQFLQESSLLVLISFVLAIISVEVLLPSFNNLTGKSIVFEFFNSSLGLWFSVLALITIFISGLYPAVFLSRFKTIMALKGKVDKRGAGGAGALMRKGMVVFQFVIAGGLIFATVIIAQQVDFIFNNDKNIERSNIIVLNNDDALIYQYESFRSALLQSPSIESVTSMGALPINIYATTGDPVWEGRTGNEKITGFRLLFTEPDFFSTMKLEMAEGRAYSRELATDSSMFIVNEAAIRGMDMKDPIGKRFSMWGIDGHIIGVVKDFHVNSVYEEIFPLVIANALENTSYVTIRAAEGRQAEAIAHMQSQYAEFMPGHIFDYQFLADSHRNMYQNELMVKDLARIFGLIAIFISCLGLFGLTSINAERNVKEIGVRKVLGASIRDILFRFSGQSLILPGIASLLMIPLAYLLMSGWLENFRYHVEIEAWTLGAVVIASLLIAWATVSFIALRAAKANPINSLRNE